MKWFSFGLLVLFSFTAIAQRSDFESIDFTAADSLAASQKNAALTNLPELAYNLTNGLNTNVEKFRSIYRWVTANIANDYGLYLKTKRKKLRFKDKPRKLDNWNNEHKLKVFEKLLEDKRTICTGYAYLVKELSRLSGLDCKIIHGFGRTSTIDPDDLEVANHSWNAVKLNGKWYLSDATWASGIPDPESNIFTFSYNDGLFLTNPELFAINHYPVEEKWLLLNDNHDYTFEEFLEAPVFYNNAYIYLEKHNAPQKLNNTIKRNQSVSFNYEVTDKVKADDIQLMIGSDENARKIKPESISLNNGLLNFDHTFNYRGTYDVHLMISGKLIASYTFRVKK